MNGASEASSFLESIDITYASDSSRGGVSSVAYSGQMYLSQGGHFLKSL